MTIVLNAEKLGGPSAVDDDPRITRIGRLISKYKLDELLQLISVLEGEMSLLGQGHKYSIMETLLERGDIILGLKVGFF